MDDGIIPIIMFSSVVGVNISLLEIYSMHGYHFQHIFFEILQTNNTILYPSLYPSHADFILFINVL